VNEIDLTYAKRKAAIPATAATATEPWTLDAAPVKVDGEVGTVGEVLLPAELTGVEETTEALAELVGETVMVE